MLEPARLHRGYQLYKDQPLVNDTPTPQQVYGPHDGRKLHLTSLIVTHTGQSTDTSMYLTMCIDPAGPSTANAVFWDVGVFTPRGLYVTPPEFEAYIRPGDRVFLSQRAFPSPTPTKFLTVTINVEEMNL